MSPGGVSENRFCSECGQPRPLAELARFGDRLICPACKNSYARNLGESVAPAMAVAYGGFWIRVVAAIIDGIVCYVITTILDFATIGNNATRLAENPADLGAAMSKFGLAWLISMAVSCGYETFFVGRMAATPGKMALGLKVVRADGSRLDYARAAGRYFAKVLSAIIFCIGYIMVAFDSEKRGLHDRICDTRVIKTRA